MRGKGTVLFLYWNVLIFNVLRFLRSNSTFQKDLWNAVLSRQEDIDYPLLVLFLKGDPR